MGAHGATKVAAAECGASALPPRRSGDVFGAEAGCARGPAAAPRFAFGGDRPVPQREGELSGNTLVSSDIFRRLAGCLV